MLLPTEKTQPKQKLEDYSILLYGQPKIGKSTFCSQMNNPLFLATEAGLNALEVYQVPITQWSDLGSVYKELRKGNHDFSTVVIDTVDNLWKLASEHVCKQNGIMHESDLGFGKGWQMVKNIFLAALNRFALLPTGLVLTSHVEMTTVKKQVVEHTKAVPSLAKSGKEIVLGMADIILYADSVMTDDGEQRVIHTKPSENWDAGDRTGRLPGMLPLDFQAFNRAFHIDHTQQGEIDK